MIESRISAGEQKNCQSLTILVFLHGRMIWRVMQRSVWNDIVSKTTQQLYKVSTPCIDDHHFKEEEIKSFGELSQVCSQIVLKCLYLRGAHDTLSSHIARTLVHLVMSSHTSLAQDLSLVMNISIVIHERTSLRRLSLSTSTCLSLSSSLPSTSCTSSCTLSSTT